MDLEAGPQPTHGLRRTHSSPAWPITHSPKQLVIYPTVSDKEDDDHLEVVDLDDHPLKTVSLSDSEDDDVSEYRPESEPEEDAKAKTDGYISRKVIWKERWHNFKAMMKKGWRSFVETLKGIRDLLRIYLCPCTFPAPVVFDGNI